MSQGSEDSKKRQLYNRQEYVVGADTQRKYGSSHFLVVGMTGLGCEIVKNLMLTGVGGITIVDDAPIRWSDLSSMFYAAETDVGKPRAKTLEPHLAELNRYVTLRVHSGAVTASLISAHQVVMFVDHCTTRLQEYDALSLQCGAKFVSCESRGIAGCIYANGGQRFVVNDPSGEDTVSCVVTGVSADGIILCHDDKKHECCEGDFVYFTHISGPLSLNTMAGESPKLFRVTKVIGPFILQIEAPDLPQQPPFAGSGYMHTTKQPKVIDFLPLEEAVRNPAFTFIDDDEAKFTAASTLHTVFQKLHDYETAAKTSLAFDDEKAIAQIVEQALLADPAIDAAVARAVVTLSPGNLNAMACVIGGLASQEALKLASGKFTPVTQWLYYDCREILVNGLPETRDRRPINSRYDGSILVLGKPFQDALHQKSCFVVGAGALGCEFVKNFACMGISCGSGKLHITDMDRIELSNLSRQFLFRHQHIGHPKSTVAAAAAKQINGHLNIRALEEKVGVETEALFNEDFWTSLDFVVGALDNVLARKYVDSRCVFFKKALFESGTLGTKCSTQPVIPYLTESYGSSYDPPEKSIPLCTLKNFPTAIEHTIQWARDCFEKHFVNTPNDVNGYLHDDNFLANLNNDPGNKPSVFSALVQAISQAPRKAEDSVAWARIQFEELFRNNILQLLHNLPLDKVGENGQPFWSGAKKPPTPIIFDAKNELHMEFIVAAASLHAASYERSIASMTSAEIIRVCETTPVTPFLAAAVAFATSEKEKTQLEPTGAAGLTESDLPKREKHASLRMIAAEFEKDDDANHHVDFITAVSNLRATNYGIPAEDKVKTKMIAGKIIPAMVTTTALVTGFVGIEVLKYLLGANQVSQYKCAFINIALPLLSFSNPIAPKVTSLTTPSGEKRQWSLWDRFDVDIGRELTLKELVDYMTQHHHVEPTMMSTVEGKLIYSSFLTKPARLVKKVSEVVEEVAKAPIPAGINHLSFVITPDEDIEVPLLRYRFRW